MREVGPKVYPAGKVVKESGEVKESEKVKEVA